MKNLPSKKRVPTSILNGTGQIVVEYVLLLSIAVSMALIIVSILVKRDADNAENSGSVIRKWQKMQEAVAADKQN